MTSHVIAHRDGDTIPLLLAHLEEADEATAVRYAVHRSDAGPDTSIDVGDPAYTYAYIHRAGTYLSPRSLAELLVHATHGNLPAAWQLVEEMHDAVTRGEDPF